MASSKAIRTSNGFSEIWKEKRGAMRRAAELVIFEKTKTATVIQCGNTFFVEYPKENVVRPPEKILFICKAPED